MFTRIRQWQRRINAKNIILIVTQILSLSSRENFIILIFSQLEVQKLSDKNVERTQEIENLQAIKFW